MPNATVRANAQALPEAPSKVEVAFTAPTAIYEVSD